MTVQTADPTTLAIPTVKELPLLGSAISFRRELFPFIQRSIDLYGNVFRFHLAGTPVIIFNGHAYVQSILVEKADAFFKGSIVVNAIRPFLGKGLFLSEGEFHRKQRKMIAPTLTARHVQSYAESMVEYTEQHVAQWRDGEVFDITEQLKSLTLRIVGKVLFGQEDFSGANALHRALEIVTEQSSHSISALVRVPESIPTPRNRRAAQAMQTLEQHLQSLIDERMHNPEQYNDSLSLLLLARDEDGKPMEHRQVIDEAMNLFGGGNETIPVALTWMWYYLAQHPDLYDRLQQETTQVLNGRPATIADLSKLPYSMQVFKEAMRICPPAGVAMREALHDVQIGGYLVPKGTTVIMPYYIMHHNSEYFPNPETYDPDRFAPEREKQLPRNAYIPFGAGAHICIGNHFAWLEGHLLTAIIARHVRLELLPGQHIEPDPNKGLALRPSAKVMMKVHRID